MNIPFPNVTPDMRVGSVAPIDDRMNRKEYLELAKTTLKSFDYERLLLSIMDEEYYETSDNKIQGAVDEIGRAHV